jgi:hypothetical protein
MVIFAPNHHVADALFQLTHTARPGQLQTKMLGDRADHILRQLFGNRLKIVMCYARALYSLRIPANCWIGTA